MKEQNGNGLQSKYGSTPAEIAAVLLENGGSNA
jgi:hypothetical protein